jgi:predicted nucleic acid-binding protein
MHQYLKDSKIVLDTSVLVEHINSMSPYRDKIGELFKLGKNKLYTLPLILSETLYVVSKIYALANRTEPNMDALNYVNWIRTRTIIIEDHNLAISAGELKKTLNIALPDCYVIAAAKKINGIALFTKLEKEMKRKIEILRKSGVLFIEEINI